MNNMEITPEEAGELLNGEDPPALVDVREQGEWDLVHLEGGRLLTQQLMDEMMESWDKQAPVICYCHHGVRSVQATLYLRQQGFTDVRSMRGGIDAWATTLEPEMARY